MALYKLTPEKLIERLSWRPDYILKKFMIRIDDSVESNPLRRTLESSSLGTLETLPIELLHSVFNYLDFRSLSRLARACRRAKEAVESLPAYRDMVKHASATLIALSRTRLINVHCATSIQAALRTQTCVCCPNYAPFLFLLTCERCCYECLYKDPSLRVITSSRAKFFGVNSEDLSRLPIMIGIPGTYSTYHIKARSIELVSLKQVIELGIAVHGSRESMDSFIASPSNRSFSRRLLCRVRCWVGEPLDYQYNCASSFPHRTSIPPNALCGAASIWFPSLLQENAVEKGLWCVGCRISAGGNSFPVIEIREPDALKSKKVLERLGRSRAEFLEHVRECEGARALFQKLELEMPSGWTIGPSGSPEPLQVVGEDLSKGL